METKNGLEMFVEELEDLIVSEEQNSSPKSSCRGRLWELSIITKSIQENLKYLKGFLAREKHAKFKFICALGYIFNLDRIHSDETTPKNYLLCIETIANLNKKMHRAVDSFDYDLSYKIIEEALNISISLWLEEAKNFDLKPLNILIGKEQEDYMRLLTDLTPEHDQYFDDLIPYFIKLIQSSPNK